MVRSTEPEVLKLFLGVYPASVNATNVGNILAGVDYSLDGWVKRNYKTSLSTTDTAVIHIANLMAKQVVLKGMWARGKQERPEPILFTEEIIAMIEAAISDTESDGFKSVAMQED